MVSDMYCKATCPLKSRPCPSTGRWPGSRMSTIRAPPGDPRPSCLAYNTWSLTGVCDLPKTTAEKKSLPIFPCIVRRPVDCSAPIWPAAQAGQPGGGTKLAPPFRRPLGPAALTNLRGPQNSTRDPANPARDTRKSHKRPRRFPQEAPGAPTSIVLWRGLASGSACWAPGGRLWTLGVALVGFCGLGWPSGGSSKNPPS